MANVKVIFSYAGSTVVRIYTFLNIVAIAVSVSTSAIARVDAASFNDAIQQQMPSRLATTALDDYIPRVVGGRNVSIHSIDEGSAVIRHDEMRVAALIDPGDAAPVGASQAVPNVADKTVQDKPREWKMITDYGRVVADGTVQNNNIIKTLTEYFDAADRITLIIPPGVRWNPQVVMADAGVKALEHLVLFDLAGYNAGTSSGENTKVIGVFSIDRDATEDTLFGHTSNHHPALLLNNTGLSGTESANIGRGSILFARGHFSDGNQTVKGALIQQYRRSFTDKKIWELSWTSLNPWEALAPDAVYTRWAASTDYAVGDYAVTSTGIVMKCIRPGKTGPIEPPAKVGSSVVDGTVKWLSVDSNDRQVLSFDQLGRIKTNGASVLKDLAAFKQSVLDEETTAILRTSPTGINRSARLYLESTDEVGDTYAMPYIQGNGGALEFRDELNGIAAILEGENLGFKMQMQRNAWAGATSGDTSPSAANISTLYLTNARPTKITNFDNGSDGQLLEVISTNANTTLVHSPNLTLTGSVNILLTPFSSVTLRRVPSSISARWVEIARSIK